jgi:hypothetical protein
MILRTLSDAKIKAEIIPFRLLNRVGSGKQARRLPGQSQVHTCIYKILPKTVSDALTTGPASGATRPDPLVDDSFCHAHL